MFNNVDTHENSFWKSTTQQYKFQLRGAILVVVFQLFAVLFLYLMSWNYALVRHSLTPMFWAVLFSIALHGVKTSAVQYLIWYDECLRTHTIQKVKQIKEKSRFFWWLHTQWILIPFFRFIFVWKPFSVKIKEVTHEITRRLSVAHESSHFPLFRTLSEENMANDQKIDSFDIKHYISNSNNISYVDEYPITLIKHLPVIHTPCTPTILPPLSPTINASTIKIEFEDDQLPDLTKNRSSRTASPVSVTKKCISSSENDADDEAIISDLSDAYHTPNNCMIVNNNDALKRVPSFQLIKKRLRNSLEYIPNVNVKKVTQIASSISAKICTAAVILCAILYQSNMIHLLGLSNIVFNLFLFLLICAVIILMFVLIPSWHKDTYNIFVVSFLLLLMLFFSTLITAVISFKIADEIQDIVTVMNQIVNSSDVFKDMRMDIYINQTSLKIMEMLQSQFNLPPEMTAQTFEKILNNEHINWTNIFDLDFFDENGSVINDSMDETLFCLRNQSKFEQYLQNTFIAICVELEFDEEIEMEEVLETKTKKKSFFSEVTHARFYLQLIEKVAISLFGEQSIIVTILRMDFKKYINILKHWGFDFLLIKQILQYVQQLTSILYGNIFGAIQLFLSISSWIIHLGLDFMIFITCLFYLLLDSDSITSQILNIVSFVPSTKVKNENDMQSLMERRRNSVPYLSRNVSQSHQFFDSLFKSIRDIFIVTFEISLLHGLVTSITFTYFDVNFAFITAFASAIFSIIPYFPPWIVCLHGVITLLCFGQWMQSLLLLASHIALLQIDPYLYERIENSHPYLTGLSIVLGLAEFGLNGVILGPLLVCITSWSLKVVGYYLLHFATFDSVRDEEYRSKSENVKSKQQKMETVFSEMYGGIMEYGSMNRNENISRSVGNFEKKRKRKSRNLSCFSPNSAVVKRTLKF